MSNFKEKFKDGFLKCLPLLIVLTSVGLFTIAVKWIVGTFYAPSDTVTEKLYGDEKYVVVQCYQAPSTTYYVYGADYVYDAEAHDNAANEHENAHLQGDPLVYFILNETALDMENTTVKTIYNGNALHIVQLGEFVLYRLEGQYGVFAPLRDYKESTTSRKNDLYVVRQLMKDDRWTAFDLPEGETAESFYDRLEKIEWYLDTEYEDN